MLLAERQLLINTEFWGNPSLDVRHAALHGKQIKYLQPVRAVALLPENCAFAKYIRATTSVALHPSMIA